VSEEPASPQRWTDYIRLLIALQVNFPNLRRTPVRRVTTLYGLVIVLQNGSDIRLSGQYYSYDSLRKPSSIRVGPFLDDAANAIDLSDLFQPGAIPTNFDGNR
jgi:hypothetical protein